MNSMELPLVIFTVLAQAAVGLSVFSVARQWAAQGPAPRLRTEWIAAAALLGVGLLVSLAHLGDVLGAPRAIVHLSSSWLSREVLAFMAYGVLAVGAVAAVGSAAQGWVTKLAAVVGLAALFVQAMVYSPPSFPALNNGLPLAFFLVTAAVLGASLAAWFAAPERQPLLARLLAGALVVGLAVHLLAPWIWLSGGAVMAMTGEAHLGSGLYWLRIAGGLALPLAVVLATRRVPAWLFVLLLAGELLGRALFFSHVAHTAANMGMPY
jgi:DMSO reductase anchor subunit